MTTRASLYVLVALNLAVLAFSLVQQLRPVFAADEPPMLRGRGLQIVDDLGRVRASISVLPPSADEQSETVLLRLITERGRPDRHEGQLPHPADKRHDPLAAVAK